MNRQTDEQLELLRVGAEQHALCAVNRDLIDYLSIYGYPLAITKNLVALRFVYDFAPDGIKIIRTQDITEVFCGEAEAFNDRITKAENADIDYSVPLLCMDSMKSLCKDLANMQSIAAIECESYEESLFYVGKVLSAGDKQAELLTFDGLGIWDKKSVFVDYKKITCVGIDSRYVNTISKYLQSK